MYQPLVSIITPTYNHEKYITDCIQSVRKQTYHNWEMLIVNDGSTDRTSEIVRSIIKDEPRIKLFDRKNVGIFKLGETYNFAVSKASGDYIAILEGDDIWMEDKLERQVEALENDKSIVLSWGKAQGVNHNNTKVYGTSPRVKMKHPESFFNNNPPPSILNILYFDNCIPAVSIFIRKSVLEKIGGFRQTHGLPLVDLPTLFELAKMGPFHYDDEVLGRWRTYSNQTTKRYPVEILTSRYELVLEHYSNLNNELKSKLSISEQDIKKHFIPLFQSTYARSGRYKLIQKEFKQARRDYLKAIFYPTLKEPLWKIRAITGYILSFFNMDVEWLAKVMGRKVYH